MKAPLLAVAEFDSSLEQAIFEPEFLTNAKTVQWNRLERMGVATTPAQLTEGVAPKPEAVTLNNITATMEEYGRAVYFSSLAVLTTKSPLIQGQIKNLGFCLKETRDRLLYAIANAATNVSRVNDRANDNATAVGDFISMEEVQEFKSTLAGLGAPKKPDGAYVLVLHTTQYGNLAVDPNWLQASVFSYADEIRMGMVNYVVGVRVFETNSNSFAATASTTTGNSSKIRSGFIAGAGAAKVTDLKATEIHTQVPGAGSDWTKRRYQLGWTGVFKGAIVNQSFIRKIRASSNDATAVA